MMMIRRMIRRERGEREKHKSKRKRRDQVSNACAG